MFFRNKGRSVKRQHPAKGLLALTLLSYAMSLLAVIVVVFRIFEPFHITTALVVYIASYVPFVIRIYKTRDVWRRYTAIKLSREVIVRERKAIIILASFLLLVLMYLTLRPVETSTFSRLSDSEIQLEVSQDVYGAAVALDYLESSGENLIQLLQKDETATDEEISQAFDDFLLAVMYSETLTDKHRYFDNIPYRLWDERIMSFTIAYSLYVKKYELLHRLMLVVSRNEAQKDVLNSYRTLYDRDRIYTEMVNRYYAPKSRLRINVGRIYLAAFSNTQDEYHNEVYQLLVREAQASYGYLFDNFDATIIGTNELLSDNVEQKMFDVWVPINQVFTNSVDNSISDDRSRPGYITPAQLAAMQPALEPGDIFLVRSNWRITNVGIPGFWTHTSLYTGTFQELDVYFDSLFPQNGYKTFSELVAAEYPVVYERYQTDPDSMAVIEAMKEGVIIEPMTVSLNSDFVAVLRPQVEKQDVLQAITTAYSHFQKPYDFAFDFQDDSRFYCSELVYSSYLSTPQERRVIISTSTLAGKELISPHDIAEKYRSEVTSPDRQLEFIYFLAGNEQTKAAEVADEQLFLSSIDWNKFSFLQRLDSRQ